MSTHSVQETQDRPGVDHIDTQDVIMKDTDTTTTETLSSPVPSRSRRGVVAGAGLIVFATVTLTRWLLTSSSDTQHPMAPTQAAVSPQQQAPAAVQANAGSNGGNVHSPTGYIQFCYNSPSLCNGTAPTALATGHVQFCEGSPTLCILPRPR
jgi:hypothetical protein